MNNLTQKLTVIHSDEQQLTSKKNIVDNIINILANNGLSINEAMEILRVASHRLGRQKITTSF